MAQWGHGELEVNRGDDSWTWTQFGGEPMEFDASAPWQLALRSLGGEGWELVQVISSLQSAAYWMKRQFLS
jgi:hypothetical protein